MSRGFPSMTALLGLLAIAGYQNRDKLAEMFRNATAGGPDTAGAPKSGSPDQLGGLLGGAMGSGGVGGFLNGGIGELLERFRENGQGPAAESWVKPGPNKEISASELKQAIGPDGLDRLAQQTGLATEEILSRLTRELPAAIDKYTPDGRLPDAG